MNEEENLKEETVEVSGIDNADCQEKLCEEECQLEGAGKIINKITFFKSLEAIVLDQLIIFILSAVCILLLSLILNVIGFYILSSYYIAFLLIAYVFVSILYPAIMEACIGNTLGRIICKLKIVKI